MLAGTYGVPYSDGYRLVSHVVHTPRVTDLQVLKKRMISAGL